MSARSRQGGTAGIEILSGGLEMPVLVDSSETCTSGLSRGSVLRGSTVPCGKGFYGILSTGCVLHESSTMTYRHHQNCALQEYRLQDSCVLQE